MLRQLFVIVCSVVGVWWATYAADVRGQEPANEATFKAFWTHSVDVLDTIQQHHPLPPTRQEMLARGLAALNPESLSSTYPDLVKRVSQVAPEKLEQLCAEVWSQQLAAGGESAEMTRRFMFGVSTAVPGAVQWVPASEAQVTKQLQENRYVGIGISLQWNAELDQSELLQVFYGGPAWTAKLQSGDRIIEIDGETAEGVGLLNVIQRLRGPLGTELSVKVERNGELISADMTRLEVPIATVESIERKGVDRWNTVFDSEQQLGYLKLVRVAGSTAAEMRSLLRQAQEQGCRGLILDLRRTEGGDYHQTLMLADVLFGNGVIGRRLVNGKVEDVRSMTPAAWEGKPLVVLMGTTSSADLVWLVDALRQREDVKVVGWPFVVDGFLTENKELSTGGLLENLPHGFLLLHPGQSTDDGPQVADHLLSFDGKPKVGQIAMVPDVRLPPAMVPPGFDRADAGIVAATQILSDLLD